MKARAITLITACLFALALLFTAAAPAVPAKPSPVPAPVPAPAPEKHPQIQNAINALRNAKVHLEEAKHDFGGHRAAAIGAVNNAIEQLEICMKY